jgi:hypothetical protein
MANIENAQVIAWSNNRARTLADKLTAAYYAAKAYQTDYAAGGIAAAMAAADNADVVLDGSAQDGRTPVTKLKIINFLAAINQIVTSWETNVSGVGSPVTTIENGIQVNGSPT